MSNKDNAPKGLVKDHPDHRNFSNYLDEKLEGRPLYEKGARPLIHGTYHAGRSILYQNEAEWARAKDQYSAVFTGQPRTEYLKAYKEQNK